MSKITISLTGHRPTKLAGYNLNKDYYKRLQAKLESVIDQTLENMMKSNFIQVWL